MLLHFNLWWTVHCRYADYLCVDVVDRLLDVQHLPVLLDNVELVFMADHSPQYSEILDPDIEWYRQQRAHSVQHQPERPLSATYSTIILLINLTFYCYYDDSFKSLQNSAINEREQAKIY